MPEPIPAPPAAPVDLSCRAIWRGWRSADCEDLDLKAEDDRRRLAKAPRFARHNH
jgi:hypothetical protein